MQQWIPIGCFLLALAVGWMVNMMAAPLPGARAVAPIGQTLDRAAATGAQ